MLSVPVVEPEVKTPVVEVPETKEEEPVIENIKAEKIEGPKILGKIDLPVESDTRPPKVDEKRKRKRIPIEKKEVRPSGFREAGQGQQAGQGGGGRFTPQRNTGGQTGGFNRGGAQTGGGGGGRFTPTRRGDTRTGGREVKEIDNKEIQRKIQETQAKLSGGGGGGRGAPSAPHARLRPVRGR